MNTRGFTVMEILVALFIFSIVLLPLTELLVADSKFEKSHEQKLTALLVAKNEVEKVKRTYKKIENGTYQVAMAGKQWNVALSVEEKERTLIPASSVTPVQPPQQRGMPLPPPSSPLPAPSTFMKRFITVTVSRANDTNVLAEFRVLGETYK
jgi:type II secretion system protein I